MQVQLHGSSARGVCFDIRITCSLAEHCNFGTAPALQDMLRDCLVCGINNTQMQQQLLAKNLTFESALSLVLSLEAAARNVQTLQGAPAATTATPTSESTVHKVETGCSGERGVLRLHLLCPYHSFWTVETHRYEWKALL